MKISLLYLAIILTAAIASLSSCASLQKGEFAQRKYYDFPRTKHSIEKKETASDNNYKQITPQNIIFNANPKTSEPLVSVSATNKGLVHTQPEIAAPLIKKYKTINTTEENESVEVPVISYKKSDILKNARKNFPYFPSDAELMLFIAVVAAILLPPLGIYIKENWRITNWFWVTLILCILSGGIWGFGIMAGAGLWLIAAIIALLVVFDVL